MEEKSLNSAELLFQEYRAQFPYEAKEVLVYYESAPSELTLRLSDGSIYIYDALYKTSTRSRVGENRSKEERTREFVRRVKRRAAILGKSQQDLSEEIGVSRKTINTYLNGNRSPDVELILDLAEVLSCEPSDLYDGLK